MMLRARMLSYPPPRLNPNLIKDVGARGVGGTEGYRMVFYSREGRATSVLK